MNNLRSENFLILWFRCKLDEEKSALYQQSLTTAATINILVLFSLQISFIFLKPSPVRYYKLDCSSTKQNHIKVLTILCSF